MRRVHGKSFHSFQLRPTLERGKTRLRLRPWCHRAIPSGFPAHACDQKKGLRNLPSTAILGASTTLSTSSLASSSGISGTNLSPPVPRGRISTLASSEQHQGILTADKTRRVRDKADC